MKVIAFRSFHISKKCVVSKLVNIQLFGRYDRQNLFNIFQTINLIRWRLSKQWFTKSNTHCIYKERTLTLLYKKFLWYKYFISDNVISLLKQWFIWYGFYIIIYKKNFSISIQYLVNIHNRKYYWNHSALTKAFGAFYA